MAIDLNEILHIDTDNETFDEILDNVATALMDYRITTDPGQAARDVGMLCTSPNINKWAKYKPVEHPSAGPLTESQRAEVGYGLSINTTVIGDIPTELGVEVIYVYNKPTTLYRITDFDGYKKNIESPMDFRKSLYTNRGSYNGTFDDDNDFPQWDGELVPSRFFVIKLNPEDANAFSWDEFTNLIGTSSVSYSVHLYNPKYHTDTIIGSWIHGEMIPPRFVVTLDTMLNSVLRGDEIKLYIMAQTSHIGAPYVCISPMRFATVDFTDGLEFEVGTNFYSTLQIGSPTSGSNSISYWGNNILRLSDSDDLAFYGLSIQNNGDKAISHYNLLVGIAVTDSKGNTITSHNFLYRGTSGSPWTLAAGASITDTFIVPYYFLNIALGLGLGTKDVKIALYTEGEDIFNGGETKYFKVSDEFTIRVNR